jgi:nicotinate-nucleotide pyrophosphorylase (carboxylating)
MGARIASTGDLGQTLPRLSLTPAVRALLELAFQEDMSHGDATTEACGIRGTAWGHLFCREPSVCCGLPVARWLVTQFEPELELEEVAQEGELLEADGTLLALRGPSAAVLRIERTMLNFLMRMCGVATLSRAFVAAVSHTRARVVDTRKTIPGWRAVDKYAVRVGGGSNHRHDLASGILIKDNHIAACGGSVALAVQQARSHAPHPLRIEVEVVDLAGVDQALRAKAEIILLDNMSVEQVREAVSRIGGRALVEVSGGIDLSTIAGYAEAGADLISVGALTHSAAAVNLSLDLRLGQAV